MTKHLTGENLHQQTGKGVYIIMLIMMALALAFAAMMLKNDNKKASVMTTEGIVSQIQSLSRLQTVAFSVDTIVTANKDGTWQALWQDRQKGLFIVKGRVLAGVDLANLNETMVKLEPTKDGTSKLQITLPPAEIFEVFLDDIVVYDWQTGLFGATKVDPKLFAQVQADAKREVLQKACQGDVLTLAMSNASEQVQKLFSLTATTVELITQGTGSCQLPSK
ncbi:DUF4230 domain-containing protein [Moraxella cuniculi]|uniref:DUF4230 domain-containing protein n=1 Tax=Moraxella cuniculi TaxID=34061 RepID=A0A448GVI4_9GAMM|nr:DUF4230 domain-containing protein [Moraxella cuniculi]VEG12796.1 Uncharacterised protein [Moraxella cuniculi]